MVTVFFLGFAISPLWTAPMDIAPDYAGTSSSLMNASGAVRDKIAASKKKGLWMGGNVPLGYDVDERALVINPAQAEIVRRPGTQILGFSRWRSVKVGN